MNILSGLRVPQIGGTCHDCGIALDEHNQVVIHSVERGVNYFYRMCKSCYAKHARNRSETKKHTFVFIQNGKPVKRCADCGNVLPVSHFSTDVSKRDGIKATCKKCAETRAEERKIKKAVKKDTMFFEAAPEEYLVNLICQRIAKIIAPVAEDIHYLRHLWQETKNNEG